MLLYQFFIELAKLARWRRKVTVSNLAAALMLLFCVACEKVNYKNAGNAFEGCRDKPGQILNGRTLCFNARIDDTSLEQLRARFGEFENLAITSDGGTIKSAIELTELLRSSDIAVGVVGRCASGCAQYVMFADEDVYIGEKAELLVHTKSFDALLLKKRDCEKIWPFEERPLVAWKQRQVEACLATTSEILNALEVQDDFLVHRPQLKVLYDMYDEFIHINAAQLASLEQYGIRQRDVYLLLGKTELLSLGIRNISPNFTGISSYPICEVLSSRIVVMPRSGCPNVEYVGVENSN